MDPIEPETESPLRQIPAVDDLLSRPGLRQLEARVGHRVVVEATRKALEQLRETLRAGTGPASRRGAGVAAARTALMEQLEREILDCAEAGLEPSLQPVINATGVILHTNLGRAPLAREALQHLARAGGAYSNLEYDLERGERGKRDVHTDGVLARLLGAERALVVNNNAAAVFLALNTLAEGAEVVVSRGELIEIGGEFRIPDICAKSGATLREVGTTNRTRAADYAAAINERTRLLLRVHPSNFRIIGFTERPALEELVVLARENHLLLMEDLGSGCLVDLTPCGIRDEPVAGASVRAGADLVTFSGDKLLGGPQAGIVAGKNAVLERLRRNPLFRALRVDKLTIAALEATAALYFEERHDQVPVLRMLRLPQQEITRRARRLAERIGARRGFSAIVRDGQSVLGGGSTPGQGLETSLVAVRHRSHGAAALEGILRRHRPAIIGRIEKDDFILDLRTVFEDQDDEIGRAFEEIE